MSIFFIPEEELTVEPLTKKEKLWVERLHKTLQACPFRLEMTTIGDADLSIVDVRGALVSELSDGAARRDGVELAIVDSACTIHGISG